MATRYVSSDHARSGTVLQIGILGKMYGALVLGASIYGANMRL